MPYFDAYPRQHGQTVAQIVHYLVLAAIAQLKRHFHFAAVYAHGMFVEFGASRLSRYGFYFGHLQNDIFGLRADAVAFLERNAGQRAYIDSERAFVERRQKGAA